jgi:hypothetical protein
MLVATREEQMSLNEWYGHEASALKAGLDQSIIDLLKFGKERAGLDAKDERFGEFGVIDSQPENPAQRAFVIGSSQRIENLLATGVQILALHWRKARERRGVDIRG